MFPLPDDTTLYNKKGNYIEQDDLDMDVFDFVNGVLVFRDAPAEAAA